MNLGTETSLRQKILRTEIPWDIQLLHVQKNPLILCVIDLPKATEDFKLKYVSTDIEEVILQYGLILICLSI